MDDVNDAAEGLQKARYAATVTAILGGPIPVTGVSLALNLPIMAANVFHQMMTLGLGAKALEIRTLGYQGKTWTKGDFLEEVKKQLVEDDQLAAAWIQSLFARTTAEIASALMSILAFC